MSDLTNPIKHSDLSDRYKRKPGKPTRQSELPGPVGSAAVIVAEAYHRLRAAAEPRGGDNPPPPKEGWDHSERVLVYYLDDPEMDRTDKWSIAYFHHNPPFDPKPRWVDFNTSRGAPDYWWPLPELPNCQAELPPGSGSSNERKRPNEQ